MKAKSEFEVRLNELEGRLNRLKSLYEQWFQGLERVPPTRQRERFDRDIRELRKRQPRNTALKFRFQTLYQRYTTLLNYWNRITRQIEEGTYKRDVQRARRRRKGREARQERASGVDVEIDVDLDAMDMDAEIAGALAMLDGPSPEPLKGDKTEPNIMVAQVLGAPPPSEDKTPSGSTPVTATFGRPKERPKPPTGSRKAPPPPRKAPPPPPRPKAGGGVDMKRIYDEYIEARRRNKQRTDNVKFETLEKQIKKMVPKLKQKHKGKKIDFEVVVKNGKVGLKPVTKD